MKTLLMATACVWCFAAAGRALAQEGTQTEPTEEPQQSELEQRLGSLISNPAKDASLFDFSYGEPGSPVLPLIGVQSDQIARVESIRKFGLTLLAGSDAAGTGPAIGLDISPYWLIGPRSLSLQQYRQRSSFERVLARTKLAAAASEGDATKATPSSLVFSLSSKLLNAQDPLNDDTFERCIKDGKYGVLIAQVIDAGRKSLLGSRPEDAEAAWDKGANAKLADLQPALTDEYKACAEKVATLMARRPALDFGAGYRLTGRPGKFRDFHSSGAILWGTFSTGTLGGKAADEDPASEGKGGLGIRGVIHARYTFSEEFYDAAGAVSGKADAGLVVAGVESVPSTDNSEPFRWSLQAGYTRQDSPVAADPDKRYWRYLAIGRFRLADGVWLNGTVGRVRGRGVEPDTYLLFGISFAPGGGKTGIENFYSSNRF